MNATFEFEEGEDPFADLNVAAVENEISTAAHTAYTIWQIFAGLVKLAVCIGSLGASVFLIYIFVKFKRLQKGCNIYFLHYAIAITVDMFFIPFYTLIHELVLRKFMGWEPMCVVFQLNSVVLLWTLSFMSAVCIDWLLVVSNHKIVQNYERFQNFVILGIYIMGGVKFIFLATECFMDISFFSNYFTIILFVVSLILVSIINYLVYKKSLTPEQEKTKYSLYIASYVISTNLPTLFLYIIWISIISINFTHGVAIFLDLLQTLADFFAYSAAIFVVYFLGKYNKYFKMAYDSVFKRKTKNYQQDNLDESENQNSQTQTQNQNNTVPEQNVVDPTGFV